MTLGKWIAAGIALAAIGGVAVAAQYRDTEEPSYDVVLSDGDFEVRDYAPMIIAEVTHSGDRRRASGLGFRRLAAYIFAQDRPGREIGKRSGQIAMTAPVIQSRVDQDEHIKMTAPVLQQKAEEGTWSTRFVMPARFTMTTLPEPPSDITLSEVPARRKATVRFSGVARDSDLVVMETMLADWIEDQKLTPIGSTEFAFYDAPMVPGRFRRNEAMIEVAAE